MFTVANGNETALSIYSANFQRQFKKRHFGVKCVVVYVDAQLMFNTKLKFNQV